MCSISLARREMQIKTTLSFHLAPVRMAMVKKTTNKCWQRCGEWGTLTHSMLVGLLTGAASMEINVDKSQKS